MYSEYTILRNFPQNSPGGGNDSVTPSYVREGMKTEQKLLLWHFTQNVSFEIQIYFWEDFEKCIIYCT